MTNFEAAVELSLNDWTASFPTEFDLPEPSAAYQKGIAELMDKMRGDRYHKFTRRTARAILIAAIIMAIATVTLAATVGRDFIVQKFSDYSTYNVVDESAVKKVNNLRIGYVPKGYKIESKEITDYTQNYVYRFNSNWISIFKSKLDTQINYDTEYKNGEHLLINGVEYIYYHDDDLNFSGLVWNNGYFVFTVEGNIAREELLKIAENIE